MNREKKYLIALFGVIRNSKVMPELIAQGENLEYINAVAYKTTQKILELIDYNKMIECFIEGEKFIKNIK